MIYRTEVRNAVVLEQEIDEKELVDIINNYLVDNHFITNKEDPESVPELDLDFIFSILKGEIEYEDDFAIYEQDNFTLKWNHWYISDVVMECIDEYSCDIPMEIIDFGDFSEVSYEKGY